MRVLVVHTGGVGGKSRGERKPLALQGERVTRESRESFGIILEGPAEFQRMQLRVLRSAGRVSESAGRVLEKCFAFVFPRSFWVAKKKGKHKCDTSSSCCHNLNSSKTHHKHFMFRHGGVNCLTPKRSTTRRPKLPAALRLSPAALSGCTLSAAHPGCLPWLPASVAFFAQRI